MNRGQFFSADFLIAFVTVTFSLGILLQSMQLAAGNLDQYAKYESNVAEVVASGIVQDPPTDLGVFLPNVASNFSLTCWRFDNGTEDGRCVSILDQCAREDRDVLVARRLGNISDGSAYRIGLVTVLSCDRVLESAFQ